MSLLSLEQQRLSSLAWLLPAVRGALVVAWPLLGVLFAIRRLSGELQPLAPGSLLLAGVVLAAVAWLTRRLLSPPLSKYLPAVALALFAIALSLPGTSWWALLGFWLLLIGEELASGWPKPRPAQPIDEEALEEDAGLLSPEVSQQFTRGQLADGGETLTCLSRVRFVSGEQTHTLHIAFCPPLDGELTARYEVLEGTPCEGKIATLESFGARVEVKRRGPLALADESLVLLEVTALPS